MLPFAVLFKTCFEIAQAGNLMGQFTGFENYLHAHLKI